MSVTFYTPKPQALLNEFNKRIAQTEPAGKVRTWERSDDKVYYTHKSSDWNKKAWFKPEVKTEKLVFNIIKPKNQNIGVVTYGYFHGHLIETFLNHFDDMFTSGVASAAGEEGDRCS